MIKIEKTTDCCGCSACAQACPRRCISLVPDKEGFWYPQVDTDLCIDCHLCEKVCPVLHPQPERVPLHTYAAINKDEDIRARSASGGMFTLVAEKILSEGGVVFGVKFDADWDVVFGYTETVEGLEAFRRSKYVQAWVGDSYAKAKEFLQQGRKVLFTGVPCQIAGLKLFLRRDYENLLTMDLLCEGVPSPKVWRRYLQEEVALCAKKIQFSPHYANSGSEHSVQIKDISFRDKYLGWKKYSFSLTLAKASADGEQNSVFPSYVLPRSAYMQLMFRFADLRPICYECPFKCCKSQSDLTIADYWGIHKLHPEMDDDKGTSMVFVNTAKGEEYFDLAQTRYLETTYEESWPFNNVVTSSKKHAKRDWFFSRADECKSLIKLMDSVSFPPSYKIKAAGKKTLKVVVGQKGFEFIKRKIWK